MSLTGRTDSLIFYSSFTNVTIGRRKKIGHASMQPWQGTIAFISEMLCLTLSHACMVQSAAERGHSEWA